MRLIDADALIDRIKNPYEQAQVARWVNEQPTIEPEKRTEERTETHACDLIDRQAAIEAIFELYEYQRYIDPTEAADLVRQGIYLAEKKIEQLPSAQPDVPDINVGDMISRADTIDDLHGKDPSQIWDTADIEVWVNALPSAQPEIIRCKDCKFYSPMNRETKTGICNLTMHQNFGDSWFCAGAERRTDECTD